MYVQAILHHPALGKNAELRAALLERNSAANAAAPHALFASMFGPEPTFIHAIRFENLAAIEAYQEKQQGDATFQAVGRKIAQCLSRPQSATLHETLAQHGAATNPKFRLWTRWCPAQGKGAELRGVLEERIQKGVHPGAMLVTLRQQVASVDGPAFSTTALFASMAAIDEWRAATAKDADFRAFINRATSLCRIPNQQQLQRVLVPFPAA